MGNKFTSFGDRERKRVQTSEDKWPFGIVRRKLKLSSMFTLLKSIPQLQKATSASLLLHHHHHSSLAFHSRRLNIANSFFLILNNNEKNNSVINDHPPAFIVTIKYDDFLSPRRE
jgi:hypothetical protein